MNLSFHVESATALERAIVPDYLCEMKRGIWGLLFLMTTAFSLAQWEVTYPPDLNEAQRALIMKLANHSGKLSEVQIQQWQTQLAAAHLPPLATRTELEIASTHVTNKAPKDRLVVIEHYTGRDIAIRTHWLKPAETVKFGVLGTGSSKVLIPPSEAIPRKTGEPLIPPAQATRPSGSDKNLR